MSKASEIALALDARIRDVRIANGYNTDIGQHVFRGKVALDPEQDLPGTVIAEGEDVVQDSTRFEVKVAQRYIIEGHDACDPDNPNDKAHLILADLKRAVFRKSDPHLGTLVKDIKYVGRNIGVRPDGTNFVAASIEIEMSFVEDLTNP